MYAFSSAPRNSPSTQLSAKGPFLFAGVLAFLSGAAALGHQLLWTRRLVDVLGASTGTFSKVIGAFFFGLALGAWLASRSSTRQGSFWRRVAFAEFAVATLALPMLFSAFFANGIYQHAELGGWMKLLLPLLLITPPATAMGLVIPWMIRALATSNGFAPKHAIWLYAVNTLGGVLGIVAVILALLPHLGLAGASVSAISLNVLVGFGALILAKPRSEHSQQRLETSTPTGALTSWEKLLAFASGFLVLAVEVVLQHQLAQVTINSLFSSAIVLVLVLIALSAAAVLLPLLIRRACDERAALRWALIAASILCAVQPFFLTGLRGGVNILPYELPPLPYLWEVVKLGLLAVCPMLLAAGLIFPLLLRAASVRDARQVGLLFAWNGAGGWAGAELGQTVIAPTLGLWNSIVLVAALYASLLLVASWPRQRPRERARWIPVSAVTFLVVAGCCWMARSLPQATVAPNERLATVAVGKEGVVATLECGPGDWRMLFNNSYTLGGSKAQFNQERQALLPLLLHGKPKSVATLGVATGSTVAGAALHPEVERIDAIELSPLVLRYAEQYFGPFNRNVFRDPKVRFIQEDARWVIAREHAAYDVVIGDLFLPWRTGEGRLFTLEHFQNVRRALKPDGVFCQWLPMFQLTRPQFETIVRTFREVFPDVYLLRGDFYTELPILGLVGGRGLDQCDWQRVEAACAKLRDEGRVTDPLVRHADGVAMMIIGPAPEPSPGPLNTLANAWLEWDAARNILGMRTPWFIGIPCAEYVRDIQRTSQPLLPLGLRPAHDAGQFFLTLEIAAKLNLAVLPQLKSQVLDHLSPSLRNDASAHWKQWPMRIKPTPQQN
jgi:spermidine synthase